MREQPRYAVHLTSEHNYVDGEQRQNPPGIWDLLSVPALFAQMIQMVCGYGVVTIGDSAAEELGLPCGNDRLPTGPAAKGHRVAAMLRDAGFICREVGRWFHVKHADGEAWVGLHHYLDADHFPMLDEPGPMTAALRAWQELTGHPWQGGAGDAGNAILRSKTYRNDGATKRPEFWSWEGPTLPGGQAPIEYPYLPDMWKRPEPGAELAVGIDRVRAYLAAMTCTEVAGTALAHDGRTEFDRRRCGWWLTRVEPWMLFDIMPDPAGYAPGVRNDDGSRDVWLTTPTVKLLADLKKDDLYDFEILDSWTARGCNVVKEYAVVLRDAWDASARIDDDLVRELVRAGLKGAYQLGHGYMRSKQSNVQRPDWAAAITATSRCNLWRAVFKIVENGGDWHGPRPMWIDTDNVFFPHDYPHADGVTVWSRDLERLDDITKLGHWRTSEHHQLDPVTGWLPPRVSRETEQHV